MKRILMVVTLLLGCVCLGSAQMASSIDLKAVEKKVAKSNEEIAHPKKSLKVKTWLKRADVMVDVSNAHMMNSYTGVDMNTMQLLAGAPVSTRTEEVNGQPYMVYETAVTEFYFLNNVLSYYKVVHPIVKDPLMEALGAYRKAIELDVKGKSTKNIAKGLKQIKSLIINEGVNSYTQADYANAVHYFDSALVIGQMPQVNELDTALYYYQGLAQFQNKQSEQAAESFARAIELGYEQDGTLYCLYYEACAAAEKAEQGKEMLEKGIEKYPEQKCLVLDLITYYVSRNENPDRVLPYVDKALSKDPENAVLYFVQGVVYDQLKQPEKALQSYEQAVSKDSKFVDAYYNMSALHYNQAVSYLNEAIELPATENEKYDALMEKVNAEFHKCIAPAERVLELQGDHKEALDLLKSVYFRYRAEPGMQEKHDAVAKKLEEIGQ